jgi:guanylate kinase
MGTLLIVSGFSGAGKGTVIEKLQELDPEIRLGISDTNRERRNDTDRYHFVSTDEFLNNLNEGKYLEYNQYGNHYYATPRKPVVDAMEQECTMILEIDVNGMRQVCQDYDLKRLHTNIISVFIAVDASILRERLHGRGDSESQIRTRMKIALDEAKYIDEYNFVLINSEVESTASQLLKIIQGSNSTLEKFDEKKFQIDVKEILNS